MILVVLSFFLLIGLCGVSYLCFLASVFVFVGFFQLVFFVCCCFRFLGGIHFCLESFVFGCYFGF